jgi:cytochrome b involved in lipid metabolism
MADTTSDKKVFTLAEVKQLAEDKNKCILIINNHIYDVTKFMDEHPGGEEVLKEQHGLDASNAFEDVGHSSDAREQMKTYEIGQLHPNDSKKPVKPRPFLDNQNSNTGANNFGTSWIKWLVPLVIVIIAIVYFRLVAKPSVDVNRPPKAI